MKITSRNRILESVHNASHPGINRTTVDMVSSQYYWPGLTNDVKIYVSKAVPTIVDVLWPSFIALHLYRLHLVIPASETITNFRKPQVLCVPFIPTKLWAQVGMDLIGPMPKTPRGNQYIVTLTDYFSKWAEAAALPDKTAHGIGTFIYTVSFYH